MITSTDKIKDEGKIIINRLKENLKSIRTGKANPSLVENLIIEAYGGQTKLRLLELANITTEGPSSLIILPYDASIISDIEKSILKSPLGLSPRSQGNRIIIKIPPLSEEQRIKLTTIAHEIIEQKKKELRIKREDEKRKIKKMFDNKEISEDEKYRNEKALDSAVSDLMKEIIEIKESKDKEILNV